MTRRWVLALALLGLLATACGGGSGRKPTPTGTDAPRPGAAGVPPSGPGACEGRSNLPTTYQHVLWIWMENRSYPDLLGPSGSPARKRSPYLNDLAAGCALATNYHNVTHPSLPNYLAATSGSTHGITDDCQPDECPVDGENMFSALSAVGRTWRAYQESMLSPCQRGRTGRYAPKHNPPVYYTDSAERCAEWDVPLGSSGRGPLADAIRTNQLPAFSFVTPDMCSDTHDCPIETGDEWLRRWVPTLLDSSAYRSGQLVVVVTWDEGAGDAPTDCARNTTADSCHIPLVAVNPHIRPGTEVGSIHNHYSLLVTRGTCSTCGGPR